MAMNDTKFTLQKAEDGSLLHYNYSGSSQAFCLPDKLPADDDRIMLYESSFDLNDKINTHVGNDLTPGQRTTINSLAEDFTKKISSDRVIDTKMEYAALDDLYLSMDEVVLAPFAHASSDKKTWLDATPEMATALLRLWEQVEDDRFRQSTTPRIKKIEELIVSIDWNPLRDKKVLQKWQNFHALSNCGGDHRDENILEILLSKLALGCSSRPEESVFRGQKISEIKQILTEVMDHFPKYVTPRLLHLALHLADQEKDDEKGLRHYFYGSQPAPIVELVLENTKVEDNISGILENLAKNGHPYAFHVIRMVLHPPEEGDEVEGKRWDQIYTKGFNQSLFGPAIDALWGKRWTNKCDYKPREAEFQDFKNEVKEYFAWHLFEGSDATSGSWVWLMQQTGRSSNILALDEWWRRQEPDERGTKEPTFQNLWNLFRDPRFPRLIDRNDWLPKEYVLGKVAGEMNKLFSLAQYGYLSAAERLMDAVDEGGLFMPCALGNLIKLNYPSPSKNGRWLGYTPEEIAETVRDYLDHSMNVNSLSEYIRLSNKQEEYPEIDREKQSELVGLFSGILETGDREFSKLYQAVAGLKNIPEFLAHGKLIDILGNLDQENRYQSQQVSGLDPLNLLEKYVEEVQNHCGADALNSIMNNFHGAVTLKKDQEYLDRHLECLIRIFGCPSVDSLSRWLIADKLIKLARANESIRSRAVRLDLNPLLKDWKDDPDSEVLVVIRDFAALGHQGALEFILDGFVETAYDKISLLTDLIADDDAFFHSEILNASWDGFCTHPDPTVRAMAYEILEVAAKRERSGSWDMILNIALEDAEFGESAVNLLLTFRGKKGQISKAHWEARLSYDLWYAEQIHMAANWEIYEVRAKQLKDLGFGASLEVFFERRQQADERQKLKGPESPESGDASNNTDENREVETHEGFPQKEIRSPRPEINGGSPTKKTAGTSEASMRDGVGLSAEGDPIAPLGRFYENGEILLADLYGVAADPLQRLDNRIWALEGIQAMSLIFPENAWGYMLSIIETAEGRISEEALRLFEEQAGLDIVPDALVARLLLLFPDSSLALNATQLSWSLFWVKQYFAAFIQTLSATASVSADSRSFDMLEIIARQTDEPFRSLAEEAINAACSLHPEESVCAGD